MPLERLEVPYGERKNRKRKIDRCDNCYFRYLRRNLSGLGRSRFSIYSDQSIHALPGNAAWQLCFWSAATHNRGLGGGTSDPRSMKGGGAVFCCARFVL